MQVVNKCLAVGIYLKREYLSPPPPPPAIRDAMAETVERKVRGLPTFDFSSGNVGNLLLKDIVKSFENMPHCRSKIMAAQ